MFKVLFLISSTWKKSLWKLLLWFDFLHNLPSKCLNLQLMFLHNFLCFFTLLNFTILLQMQHIMQFSILFEHPKSEYATFNILVNFSLSKISFISFQGFIIWNIWLLKNLTWHFFNFLFFCLCIIVPNSGVSLYYSKHLLFPLYIIQWCSSYCYLFWCKKWNCIKK
jgi:hypothetical protein